MGTAVDDELFRVFREVAPEVLGRKKTRRLLETMLAHLVVQIPPNGCGPVVDVRREACKTLIDRMRVMDEDKQAA